MVQFGLHTFNTYQKDEIRLVDGQAVKISDIIVHEFTIGDVEDPGIYAAQPLYEWQETEEGKWIMAHAVEIPYWIQHADYNSFGYKFKIVARLKEPDQVFWTLKWKR